MTEQPHTKSGTSAIGGDVIGGDKVGGDKTTIGDIQKSAVAVGDGAQAILQIIERSAVEEADRAQEQASRRLKESLKSYVQGLAEQAERARNQAGRANPYKPLLSYDLQDAPLFFGRDTDCDELMGALDRGRLTVLYAESGAGKTSLLKAGLMSRLVARRDVPVYLRPGDDRPDKLPPGQAPVSWRLKNFLVPALDETSSLADDRLLDFLRRATKFLPDRELVVLLDQFEEVFDLQGPDARSAFAKELAECLDDPILRVRWVLALRQEYFFRLGELKPIKEPFGNVVSLPRMTADQAREVIVGPSRLRGVTWEQGFVDQVLTALTDGDSGILPVQLQIVCHDLFNHASECAITGASLQAADKVKGILSNYLEKVLNEQISGQQGAARLLLEKLAASQPAMRLPKETLFALLNGAGVADNVADEVLTQLQNAFLVRVEKTDGAELVELAHRYLLEQLQPDAETREVVAARQLLDRAVQDYEQDPKLLLSAEKLAIVEAQWARLGAGDDSPAARLRKASADRIARQRGARRLGIGGAIALAVVAVVSIFSLGTARNALGNVQATAEVVALELADQATKVADASTALGEIRATATIVAQKQQDAETAAAESVATAHAAETLASDALATKATAEAAAADAEARAATASVALSQWFETTGKVQVGQAPVALVMGGGSIWVANLDSGTVQRIDPESGMVTKTIQVGGGPGSLAWDGSRLWVANPGSGTIQAIEPDQEAVVATIEPEQNPIEPPDWNETGRPILPRAQVAVLPRAILWGGNSLWLGNDFGDTIQQIDVNRQAVAERYAAKGGATAFAWDNQYLWAALLSENAVMKIDPHGGRITDRIRVGNVGDDLSALVWDGKSLWIANSSADTVQRIDPVTGVAAATVRVGDNPTALTWDGSSVWVANANSMTIQQIDPGKGDVVATIPVEGEPSALLWDGHDLWVALASQNIIQRIGPAAPNLVQTIPVKGDAHTLVWADGNVWVANTNDIQEIDLSSGKMTAPIEVTGTVSALAWDGESIWVANSGRSSFDPNTIQRIDPGEKAVVATFEVGVGRLALTWDSSKLWMAGTGFEATGSSDRSSVVQEIDRGTGAAVSTVKVKDYPVALTWDDRSLWVACYGDHYLQQIDPKAARIVQELDLPLLEMGSGVLAWDGSRLWATGLGGILYSIDPISGSVASSKMSVVGNRPVALAWDGSNLWVANYFEQTIQEIDRNTVTVAATIHIQGHPAALIGDGESLWALALGDGANTIQQFDVRGLNLIAKARRLAQERGAAPSTP